MWRDGAEGQEDETSERVLVGRARSGDLAAFDVLAERSYCTVFAIGLSRLRSADEAEDLAQETFLRAFLLLGQLRDDTRFGPWVGRIARNLAIDWQRRGLAADRLSLRVEMESPALEAMPGRTGHGPRERAAQAETSRIVMEHVNRLPVHLREVVLLHFVEGLTQEQVGQIVGAGQGAVASRLRTALGRLRGALAPVLDAGVLEAKPRPAALAGALSLVAACASLPKASIAALHAAAVTGPGAGVAGVTTAGGAGGALKLFGGVAAAVALIAALAWWLALGRGSRIPASDGAIRMAVWRDETFDEDRTSRDAAVEGGWLPLGAEERGVAELGYNAGQGALRAWVAAAPGRVRRVGWRAASAGWMPYARVGSSHYARAKFYVYAAGQLDPADSNQIPNFALRLQTRFAQNALLEVFHHTDPTSTMTAVQRELRPSTDPARPSVYRVDMDPVDIPDLRLSEHTEGVCAAFEAYATQPQENGAILLTELVLGTYPATAADHGAIPLRVYAPTELDAGDLGLTGAPGELSVYNLDRNDPMQEFGFRETTGTLGTYAEGPEGVTLDTTGVSADRIGTVSRMLTGAPAARVTADTCYRIRWHLTSTQASDRQAQVRLRADTVGGGWRHKMELGGARAAGPESQKLAVALLPGRGCLNPDRRAGDSGGWYTMLVHTPLSADIRPESGPGAPLAARMPLLSSQPGPGQPGPSLRDLVVGLDLRDTYSVGPGSEEERGNVTVDRIEVVSFSQILD